MHYDHFYTMGKTHQICQDYATQGEIPTPFIILSDGCSSSPYSEIGARILTLTSKHLLENTKPWPLSYHDFGNLLINNALQIAKQMHLPPSVLDATVMLAFVSKEHIVIYVYGDGCLLVKNHTGYLGTIEITFTHNAPYYLTYWQDKERQQEYAQYDTNPLILIDSINGYSEPKPFQTELIFRFPLNKFPIVAIASDGATQCVNTRQSTKLSLHEVADNLLNFNNFTDRFVKTHLQQLLAEYAKQGIYPADDLSIGAFVQPKLVMVNQ